MLRFAAAMPMFIFSDAAITPPPFSPSPLMPFLRFDWLILFSIVFEAAAIFRDIALLFQPPRFSPPCRLFHIRHSFSAFSLPVFMIRRVSLKPLSIFSFHFIDALLRKIITPMPFSDGLLRFSRYAFIRHSDYAFS